MHDPDTIILKVEITAYTRNWGVYDKDSILVAIKKDFSNVGRNLTERMPSLLSRIKSAVNENKNKIP